MVILLFINLRTQLSYNSDYSLVKLAVTGAQVPRYLTINFTSLLCPIIFIADEKISSVWISSIIFCSQKSGLNLTEDYCNVTIVFNHDWKYIVTFSSAIEV